MGESVTEKAIRSFVPAFFAVYFVIAFSRWIGGAHEIYPFGAWGMFHHLPQSYDVYDLRLHRLGGRDFDPPILASEADPALGLALDAHRLLVLNAFVRHTRLGNEDRAAPYLDFASSAIIGPDAEYEVLHTRARTRRRQRHREVTVAYGPYLTGADLAPRTPGQRFEFPDAGKFVHRERHGHRRLKKKK